MAKRHIQIPESKEVKDLFGECVEVFGQGSTVAGFFQNVGLRSVDDVKMLLGEIKRHEVALGATRQRIEQYIMDNRIDDEEADKFQQYVDDLYGDMNG